MPCCKKSCKDFGEIRLRHDAYGVAEVVGDPVVTAESGPGSYWYEIGRYYGLGHASTNLANLTYDVVALNGLASEFVIDGANGAGFSQAQDNFFGGFSYSSSQIQSQIDDLLEQETLDFINGQIQGFKEHIQKIRDGEAPLPAEFVVGKGLLFLIDLNNDTIVDRIFNLVNFCNSTLTISSLVSTFKTNQLTNIQSQGVMTSGGTDPVGFAQYLDLVGTPENPSRYSIVNGDSLKTCNTQGSCKTRRAPLTRELMHNIKSMSMTNVPNGPNMSSGVVIGPKLTKDKNPMFYAGPQIGPDLNSSLFSFVKGYAPMRIMNSKFQWEGSMGPWSCASFTFSCNIFNVDKNYTFVLTNQTIRTISRDILLGLDPADLTSRTVDYKLNDGSVGGTHTYYQGFSGMEGLMLTAVPGVQAFQRNPKFWMQELRTLNMGINYLTQVDSVDSLRRIAEIYQVDSGSFVNFGGDSDGNIYALSGKIQMIDGIDRYLPQFAPSFPADSEYYVKHLFDKNPACGYYADWNGTWNTDDLSVVNVDPNYDYHRVEFLHQFIEKVLSEKKYFEFEDLENLIKQQGLTFSSQGLLVDNNLQSHPMTWVKSGLKDRLLTALKNKRTSGILTTGEIDRAITLLSSYNGVTFLGNDDNQISNGKDVDGRFSLSCGWWGKIICNVLGSFAPIVSQSPSTFDNCDTSPTGSNPIAYTLSGGIDPGLNNQTDKRGKSERIYSLCLQVIGASPFARTLNVDYLTDAGITDLDATLVTSLKEALELAASGSNADAVFNTGPAGRANMDLIELDGTPLHPGWGKDQRRVIVSTSGLLIQNLVTSRIPQSNRGTVLQPHYGEVNTRKCRKSCKAFKRLRWCDPNGGSKLIVCDESGDAVLDVATQSTLSQYLSYDFVPSPLGEN